MNSLAVAGNPLAQFVSLDHGVGRKRKGHRLIIRSLIFPLLGAACVAVLYITIFAAHSLKSISQRGDFSRDILKEDHRFLDDLLQKRNYDDGRGGGSSLAAIQKVDDATSLASSPIAVPRAILVVNSEVVRRAQLVVHGEGVKHKR
jgi:hypothetical protein